MRFSSRYRAKKSLTGWQIHKPRVKYDGRFRKMSESGMQQWLDQWGAPMHSVQSRQIGQPCHNRRKWLKRVKCQVSSVSSVKCQVSSVKCQVSSVKCQVSSVSSVKCQVSSVSSVKCQVSSVKCQVSSVKNNLTGTIGVSPLPHAALHYNACR
ncbi:Uncharacterized protein HZ326_29908 [Fusarium oxysporum f. sp. albedinis]|nr:Uncharacterized protein HZ326_29908 [Fusarium oxysporum f. sp. albedinis]